MPKNPNITQLDPTQVYQRVYDESIDILRIKTIGDCYIIEEQATPTIKFVGRTVEPSSNFNTLEEMYASPIWQISKITVTGGITTTEFAEDCRYDQIWDDRATLFPEAPFIPTRSVQFDRVNDYLDGGQNLDETGTTPFTIAGWIKINEIDNTLDQFLIGKGYANSTDPGWAFYVRFSGHIALVLRGTGTTTARTTNTIVPGSWVHVIGSYDGSGLASGIKFYINGSLQTNTGTASSFAGSATTVRDLVFGSRIKESAFFGGNMAHFIRINRVITDLEAQELFNTGSPLDMTTFSAITDVTNWWQLGDNDTYPILTDSVGSIDLTMTNMTESNIVEDAP